MNWAKVHRSLILSWRAAIESARDFETLADKPSSSMDEINRFHRLRESSALEGRILYNLAKAIKDGIEGPDAPLTPVAFTLREGGVWIPWEEERNRIGGAAHSIKFSDGSILDMTNGWRK